MFQHNFMAYCLHVIEEYDLGWQPWAVQVLDTRDLERLLHRNGFGVIPLGIVAGSLGWSTPLFPCCCPA